MKEVRWQVMLGVGLVVLSALLYGFHYTVFHDFHHIFIYLVGDVAFVPIEVLMVTLIIHKLLSQREKKTRLEKLNMVIGVFFSEVGTKLLTYFSDFDPKLDEIRSKLIVKSDWTAVEFDAVEGQLRTYGYSVDIDKVDLERLRDFLVTRRDFMVRLLENPNLLEHESFTKLLRAVFHLTGRLPESDYAHLSGDMKRAYILIVREWLDYMEYQKSNYPYLFSLAMRTNPFDQDATPVVA